MNSPAARHATIGLRCECMPQRQLLRAWHVLAALLGCAVLLLAAQQCSQAPSRLDGTLGLAPKWSSVSSLTHGKITSLRNGEGVCSQP